IERGSADLLGDYAKLLPLLLFNQLFGCPGQAEAHPHPQGRSRSGGVGAQHSTDGPGPPSEGAGAVRVPGRRRGLRAGNLGP
ncbi:hypothetical protein ACFCYM_27670, partial [Streptomyces sp. NPDC056254]|uniref:hypothetical protein n=1 Tax=Streptomyces sp. NPDC056254 TaxID=3345763 RepID=UPI0035E2BC5D